MRPTVDHLATFLNWFVIFGLVLLVAAIASIALGIGPIGPRIAHMLGV